MAELTDIRFVKRIIVGSNDPADLQSEGKIDETMAFLNRCLNETPKGTIIGIEKSFKVVEAGKDKLILQWITYHVGFTRKPLWIE